MKIFFSIMVFIISITLNSQNIKRKASLGVALYTNNSDSLFKRLKLKPVPGAIIKTVIPNSNAETLKLLPNDMITQLNNFDINNASQLIQYAQKLKKGDTISIKLNRKGKKLITKGILEGKPLEKSTADINVDYGDFVFENTHIRTIIKTPLKVKSKGVIYFIQGISCYSIDNLQPLDPTKQAIDAFVKLGYTVFTAEKLGMGDSYYNCTCNEIGFNKELEVFTEGYKKLLDLFPKQKHILFGHSLGGITAPLIAQNLKADAVVVYGTALKPWSEYLLDAYIIQSRYYQTDLSALRDTAERLKLSFYKLFYEKNFKEYLINDANAQLASRIFLNFNPNTGYFAAERTLQFHQEINEHNIAKAWKNANTKVLAIYGESDIAANNKLDHEELVNYLNELKPGSSEFMFVHKTNHTFQKVGSMKDYVKMENEDPIGYQKFALNQFNEDLFKNIDAWLNKSLLLN